ALAVPYSRTGETSRMGMRPITGAPSLSSYPRSVRVCRIFRINRVSRDATVAKVAFRGCVRAARSGRKADGTASVFRSGLLLCLSSGRNGGRADNPARSIFVIVVTVFLGSPDLRELEDLEQGDNPVR